MTTYVSADVIKSPLVVQARLDYVSTTSIKLSRINGSRVPIWDGTRWVYRTLSSEPTLANTGIGNFTTVNIYAYWTGSAIALEYSATAWTTDSDGMPYKTGDKTRLLVGKVFTNVSGQFIDTAAHRGVTSYWNRKSASLLAAGSTLSPTQSNAWENVGSVFARFVSFSGDYVEGHANATVFNSTTQVAVYVSVGFDSQSAANGTYSGNTSYTANVVAGASGSYHSTVAEGSHYMAVNTNVSTHTNTTISVNHIAGTVFI